MPRQATKYPFGTLLVGQAAVVTGIPNRNAVYVALARFRDAVLTSGLASPDSMPLFAFEWEYLGDRSTVRVSRLPDGPVVLGRHAPPLPHEQTQDQRDLVRVHDFLVAHRERHMLAEERGLPRPSMAPLDIVELAHRVSPAMAQELADLDTASLTSTQRAQRQMDRLMGEEVEPIEHPAIIERRSARRIYREAINHELNGSDLPADQRLIARLGAACSPTQS